MLLLDGIESPEGEEYVYLVSHSCRTRSEGEHSRELVVVAAEGYD